MLNIIHLVDLNLISSINKEMVWDDVASPLILPLLIERYNSNPIVMGYNTWKSTGEKKIGETQNYVLSRRKRKLPRGIKQPPSPGSMSFFDKDKQEYNIIGGVNLIASIAKEDINSIYLIQLKEDCLHSKKDVEEYTVFPRGLYSLTYRIEETPLYNIRMWKKDVDT